MWKDSFKMKLLKDLERLKVYLESLILLVTFQTNEDGDKMWAIYRRDSTDVQVGGAAISTFLAGIGKKFQFSCKL